MKTAKTNKTNRPTAAAQYANHRKDIEAILELLKRELQAHERAAAAADPRDWRPAGDLESAKESLKNVLASFLCTPNDWSEAEASRRIEGMIEALRR